MRMLSRKVITTSSSVSASRAASFLRNRGCILSRCCSGRFASGFSVSRVIAAPGASWDTAVLGSSVEEKFTTLPSLSKAVLMRLKGSSVSLP